jgi:hypothetical protein
VQTQPVRTQKCTSRGHLTRARTASPFSCAEHAAPALGKRLANTYRAQAADIARLCAGAYLPHNPPCKVKGGSIQADSVRVLLARLTLRQGQPPLVVRAAVVHLRPAALRRHLHALHTELLHDGRGNVGPQPSPVIRAGPQCGHCASGFMWRPPRYPIVQRSVMFGELVRGDTGKCSVCRGGVCAEHPDQIATRLRCRNETWQRAPIASCPPRAWHSISMCEGGGGMGGEGGAAASYGSACADLQHAPPRSRCGETAFWRHRDSCLCAEHYCVHQGRPSWGVSARRAARARARGPVWKGPRALRERRV